MSILIWLGLLMLGAVFAFVAREDFRFFSGPRRRTEGRVVGCLSHTDEGSTYYSAKVRFVTDDGREVEIVDNYATTAEQPSVGDRRVVVYPRHAPEFGRVPHPFWRTVLYAFALGGIGVLVAVAAGWLR